MDEALARLVDAGVVLVEASIDRFQELRNALGRSYAQYEAARELARYLGDGGVGIGVTELHEQVGSPDVRELLGPILSGSGMTAEQYNEVMTVHRPRYQRAYAEYFAGNRLDGMIFPTTALPARPIGQDSTVELNGAQVPTFGTFARNTAPASGAGIPGLSIPAGLTDSGLPVGLEIDAPVNSDRRLLSIGVAMQVVLPPPPSPRLPVDE
jgi:mandelamide amidase